MKRMHLIAMTTAAATGLGLALANAEDIALSLVNPKSRIDIPASAVLRADAQATLSVRNTETGAVHEYPNPHVEVCFSGDISERICRLTRQIVGEPLEIVVGCETVTKPIVREPLCTRPCFQISTSDLAEATVLAKRIRNGTDSACGSPR